jgi:predicted nuclease with TOPRIM domain
MVASVINESATPITEGEMNALRLLLKEELRMQLQPFREEVNKRFDEIATQMDGLYKRDENREQEYLPIREQIRRLEARLA